MNAVVPDRLAILTVSGVQADVLFKQLASNGFSFTMINSTGGLIQDAEVSLLIGFQKECLPQLLEVVRKNCRPFKQYVSARGFVQGEMAGPPMLEVIVGGARFYLMDVERYEQI